MLRARYRYHSRSPSEDLPLSCRACLAASPTWALAQARMAKHAKSGYIESLKKHKAVPSDDDPPVVSLNLEYSNETDLEYSPLENGLRGFNRKWLL